MCLQEFYFILGRVYSFELKKPKTLLTSGKSFQLQLMQQKLQVRWFNESNVKLSPVFTFTCRDHHESNTRQDFVEAKKYKDTFNSRENSPR